MITASIWCAWVAFAGFLCWPDKTTEHDWGGITMILVLSFFASVVGTGAANH